MAVRQGFELFQGLLRNLTDGTGLLADLHAPQGFPVHVGLSCCPHQFPWIVPRRGDIGETRWLSSYGGLSNLLYRMRRLSFRLLDS